MIVSNIKRVIPDSVKQTWHDWRMSMKKAESEMTGSDEISEHVEMVGWGVDEASEANKKDASESIIIHRHWVLHCNSYWCLLWTETWNYFAVSIQQYNN